MNTFKYGQEIKPRHLIYYMILFQNKILANLILVIHI
jgi:hypothetical protein